MRPLALTWRLSILVASAMAVAIVAMGALAYEEIREFAFKQTDQSLQAMGRAAVAALEQPGLSDSERDGQLRGIATVAQKRSSYCMRVWDDATGQVLHAAGSQAARGALEAELRRLAAPPGARDGLMNLRLGRENCRAVWMQARVPAGAVNVVIAHRTGSIFGELAELLQNVLWVGLAIVGGAVVLAVLTVLLGLRPIGKAARALRSVSTLNVAQVKLPVRNVPREVRPFVESVAHVLRRLDEALKRQKAFVADASHELRTPLALAKSTLQLSLSKPRSAEEYRRSLADAVEDIRRMEHLVEELLTLARLDETQGLSAPAEVDLGQLLADLAESYSAQVAQAGGTLTCELGSARVLGEEGQLERLFANLLDNALRHGPKGGTIRLTMDRPTDGAMRVCVQDNGGSIPPQVLPYLFERFYRVDASRSQSTGGAGLGLAIAREIALRHGGSIDIVSEPAAGTQVRVILPLPGDRQGASRGKP